jgi:hypothetical protein
VPPRPGTLEGEADIMAESRASGNSNPYLL